MKTFLFFIFVLGFFILGGICFYLKTEVDTARNDILKLTATVNLQDEKINKTESELVSTEHRLKETEFELAVAHNERDEALELKEVVKKKLADTERQLKYVEENMQKQKDKTSELQTQVEEIQAEIEAIREELQLYHDTGIRVAQGIVPPYRANPNGFFNLENNTDATSNITWSQLKDFLLEDRTDSNPYLENIYTCGEFAEELHNNAETRGIKAAFVAIQFRDDSVPHALNAFMTIDRGLVYIDVTGSPPGVDGPQHMDCIVTVRIGQRLHRTLLFDFHWEVYPGYSTVSQVEIYW